MDTTSRQTPVSTGASPPTVSDAAPLVPAQHRAVPTDPAPAIPAQPAPQTTVNVHVAAPAATPVLIQVHQRGLFVRSLWYVFIGWWLSGLMMFVAGVCIGSVVLLPAGLALVNRLPQVMTLRPRSTAITATLLADGSTQYTIGSEEQRSLLVRTVYFCLVGWWAGMLVMFAAWVLSVLVVTMPLGLMLLNRVPAAVTLRRN